MTQQAELIQRIDALPPKYKGEVIDFVEYLEQKKRQETAQIDEQHKEPPSGQQSLGQQFAGALRLSDTAYEAFQNSIQEGRSEWNRNIS